MILNHLDSNNNRDDYRSSNISIKIDLGLMKIKYLLNFPLHEDSKKKIFIIGKGSYIFAIESYKIIDVITILKLHFYFVLYRF